MKKDKQIEFECYISESMTTAFTGPTAGFTIELPMSGGTTFGLDYSYIDTNPFKGCHAIGCRIDL